MAKKLPLVVFVCVLLACLIPIAHAGWTIGPGWYIGPGWGATEEEPEPPYPVPSGTSTFYLRRDTYTTFNTTGYGLDSLNTAMTQTVTQTGVSDTIYYGFKLFFVNSASYEQEITGGTPTATMSRSSDGEGIQQAAYNMSTRRVPIGAVALELKVYTRVGAAGEWTAKATFISTPLLTPEIEEATWVFNLYTTLSGTTASFSFGSSTAESKIQALSFATPDFFQMATYYLSTGNYLMFFLYPYTRLIGMGPFASIILFGFGVTTYSRFRSFYFILLVMVLLTTGGVLNLIMGDALWGAVALIATFALGALYWRVFR